MIERTVFQCEHCKLHKSKPKIYFSRHRMYVHENACVYNPKSKTCCTCIHNSYYSDKYVDEWGNDTWGHVNHCCNQEVINSGGFKDNRPRYSCEHWSNESVEESVEEFY